MKVANNIYILFLGGVFCALTSFYIHGRPVYDHEAPAVQKQALRTIIIDPGHGGFDNGTHGLISKEKEITLAISLKLGKALQETFPEIKLVFTRTTDIMPGNMPSIASGLNYRAELANKSRGDLFICIHGNSDGHAAGEYMAHEVIGHKLVGKGKRKRRVPIYRSYLVKNTRVGTGTYIWKADRSGFKGNAITQRDENAPDSSGENMGDSANTAIDMSTPEARMRAKLYEQKYFANSALFATLIEDEFIKAGRHSDGVLQRDEGIRVLQATGMPSVLIETGFLTNKEEEEYLNSEEGQDEIVRDIMSALKRYKATLEGHPLPTADSTGTPRAF